MGKIPEKFLSLIPSFIQNFFQRENLSFHLYLPACEQVMGRSTLLTDPALELAIQRLFLKMSLFYLLKEWREGRKFDLLSQDMWDLNKSETYRLTPEIQRLQKIVFEDLDSDSSDQDQQDLLSAVRAFLSNLPAEDLPDSGLEGTMQQLVLQMQMKSESYNSQVVLSALVHAPLISDGPSLQQLKSLIQKEKEGFDTLYDQYPPLHAIIKQFENARAKKMAVIKSRIEIIPSAPSLELTNFLQTVAKEIFHLAVEVEFYDGIDEKVAYVIPPSPTIHINLRNDDLKSFHNLVKDFEKGIPKELLIKRYASILGEWLNTLSHELTHLEDGSSCITTHNKKFYRKIAKKIERLTEREDHTSVLNILWETLTSKNSQMDLNL